MLIEDLNVILKVAEFRSINAAAESLDIIDGELRISVPSGLGQNSIFFSLMNLCKRIPELVYNFISVIVILIASLLI
jgi:hypothetical protein